MEKQKIGTLEFDSNGDLMSIEDFISLPEALTVDEQIALNGLYDLLWVLQNSGQYLMDII